MDWGATDRTAVLAGFVVWWTLAPRLQSQEAAERLMAYLTAMMLMLVATADLLMVKPLPFYFMVGGGLAFFYRFGRVLFQIVNRHEE